MVLEVVSGVPGKARGQALDGLVGLHVEGRRLLGSAVELLTIEDKAELARLVHEKMRDAKNGVAALEDAVGDELPDVVSLGARLQTHRARLLAAEAHIRRKRKANVAYLANVVGAVP